jgi:hypothetical protein
MTIDYQLWLTFDGENDKIRLPVLPERIDIRSPSRNASIQIAEFGELTIMQSRQALAFSFSSFLPAVPVPGIDPGLVRPPLEVIGKLKEWQGSKKPTRLVFTGHRINLFCTIENVPYHEAGGEVGALHYTLSLKEYRSTQPRQIRVENNVAVVNPAPARVDNTQPPQTYTVVPGDNLWNIARVHLGNGARYREIFELNRDIISNPNLIFAGQNLRLPA